jgi:transmembrane sensor
MEESINFDKMNFKEYSYIDFIENEHFVKWVLRPDSETNLFWNRWIANNPDREQEFSTARQFILNLKYKDPYHLNEGDFDRIHEKIIHYQCNHKPEKKFQFIKKYWSAAAAILIFVAFISIFQRFSLPDTTNVTNENIYKTTQTVKGAKHTIRLPDGTIVKINSESSLQYPISFSDGLREVFLEGEAFFEVANDIERPFIIHSSGFTTEVIGTSFNIQAYQDDIKKVTVLTGKVKVYTSDGISEYISSGQMAVLTNENDQIEIKGFNTMAEIGWKDGILYFHNESLGNVFQRLERWYGVNITVSNPKILSELYRGEFKNESLDNVLTGMGYTSGFNFKIENNKVLIYGNF